MSRKAQSSVEYLGTYAWAFLALVITVGSLSYFGIFDSSKYVKEECNSGSQISCLDSYIDTNGNIRVILKNNYEREIIIENITFKVAEKEYYSDSGIRVLPGSTITLATSTGEEFQANKKEIISFETYYKRHGSNNYHTITGTMTTVVTKPEALGDNQEQTGYCGDGITTPELGEECDPPTINDNYNPSTECYPYACLSDCTCDNQCGDGVINSQIGEECDPESTQQNTCGTGLCNQTTCQCELPN